jgi:hypothetical protein
MSLFRFFFQRWYVLLVTLLVCGFCSLELLTTVTGLNDCEGPRPQSPYVQTIRPMYEVLNAHPANRPFLVLHNPKLHDAYSKLFSLAELKLFMDNFAHAVLLPTWIALVGGLLLDSLIRKLQRKFKRA